MHAEELHAEELHAEELRDSVLARRDSSPDARAYLANLDFNQPSYGFCTYCESIDMLFYRRALRRWSCGRCHEAGKDTHATEEGT